MLLPATTLPFVPTPPTRAPAPAFPEMTLRTDVVLPPTTLPEAPPEIQTPTALGSAEAPVAAVPMRFRWTRFALAPVPATNTPERWLPDIRLPSAAAEPPTTLPDAPAMIVTPSRRFPSAPVPSAFVPIRHPTTLLVSPRSTMP